MFCPYCGRPVQQGAVFCEHCGKSLSASTSDALRATQATQRMCKYCGLPLSPGDNVCRYCFRENKPSKTFAGNRLSRIALPVAGILIVLAGILALAVTTEMIIEEMDSSARDMDSVGVMLFLDGCAVMATVLGFFPILRRSFALSIAGGVFSLIGGAFFIGIFGLVLVLLFRKGFVR